VLQAIVWSKVRRMPSSDNQRVSKHGPLRVQRNGRLIAAVILILGLLLYLHRIDRWLMDDDEGGYCYAAWRISEGEVPYRDFFTEQTPLFLYWGSTLVRVFGPSVMPMRYATVLATLLAAYFLYLAAREAFGERAALLSLALFIVHKDVYLIARFFRAEAYMLFFGTLGACIFLRAHSRRQRLGLLLSGVVLGLGTLCKLFGALPAAGCAMFILCKSRSAHEKRWIGDLLVMTVGFVAVVGGVFVAFQLKYPVFLNALFRLHIQQGAELSVVQVVAKGFKFYWDYFRGNPAFVALAMLGVALAACTRASAAAWFACQIPTAAAFLLLSRSLQDRHLVYLVPALCALAALAVERLLQAIRELPAKTRNAKRVEYLVRWLPAAVGAVVVVLALLPSWRKDMEIAAWEDTETPHFAQYIQANTAPDDVVLCEYNELNFHALRKNTYSGAGLSYVMTSTGQITGAALAQEIETDNVQMVWINTFGGASHLVPLRDYDDFYAFVQQRFWLVGLFRRSYETFEVYCRRDLIPLLPDVSFSGRLALTGAQLTSQVVSSGDQVSVLLRWKALKPMQRNYSVSLRLLDGLGHQYGQMDVSLQRTFTSQVPGDQQKILRAGTSGWQSDLQVMDECALRVSQGTPPGTYRLVATLYDPVSGEVLQALDSLGETLGAECDVATVQVTKPKHVVDVRDLPINAPLMRDLGGLRLVGRGPISQAVRPGDSLRLALFWQALRRLEQDWLLCLRVRGSDGSVLAEGRFEPANATYPTSRWSEQEVVMGLYDLTLDRAAPPGLAELTLNLVDANTGQPLLQQDYTLANLSIAGQSRVFTAPQSMQHTLGANMGNHVLLLGYDAAQDSVSPGDVLEVTLYWQALKAMDTSYKVFTHLLDSQEGIWGQKDDVPVQGTYPTTGWLPGEVITDTYAIAVRSDAPPGEYLLEVGMYDPSSGERLPVLGVDGQRAGDRVLLAPVRVLQRPVQS